jgi:hypothetical protein
MAQVRIIKRTDGVIQTQHRADERYDDTTLPPGTTAADVAAETVVDAAELEGVEDAQAQLDIDGDELVRNLEEKPLAQRITEQREAAEAVLQGLDGDADVPEAVRRYLVALRDWLNVGTSCISHPQPPAPPRGGS